MTTSGAMSIESHLCRVCGTPTTRLLTLEGVPRSVQTLLRPDEIDHDGSETLYLRRCPMCGLVQLADGPDTWQTYDGDYLCSLAFSPQAQAYQQHLAERWVREHSLEGKQVLEVGGGDGYFAAVLEELGCHVTLLQPAPRACESARRRGLKRIIQNRLTHDILAGEVFDAVVLRHVLEHVSRPTSLLRLAHDHLKPEGELFIEVPNWDAIVAGARFQDLYAEHLCYFDPRSLTYAISQSGYRVTSLYRIENGDYLVCTAQAQGNSDLMVESIEALRAGVREWVKEMNARGQRIAVWGAGGRGVALLALVGAGDLGLAYVVDSDPSKPGGFTPVTHLPVFGPERLLTDPVDVVIVTAHAYEHEILAQLRETLRFPGVIAVVGRTLRIVQDSHYARRGKA